MLLEKEQLSSLRKNKCPSCKQTTHMFLEKNPTVLSKKRTIALPVKYQLCFLQNEQLSLKKKQFPFLTVISEKEQLPFLQQNLLYEKEQGAF